MNILAEFIVVAVLVWFIGTGLMSAIGGQGEK